jgi:hypothetical protein
MTHKTIPCKAEGNHNFDSHKKFIFKFFCGKNGEIRINDFLSYFSQTDVRRELVSSVIAPYVAPNIKVNIRSS